MTEEYLPDLSKLIERLMRPYVSVTLGPSEIVDGGTKMRLQPTRDGARFADVDFVNRDTFPVLDLAKAGIDIDRRPDTLRRMVEDMLRNETFVLKPEFDVLGEYVDATLRDMAVANRAAFCADVKLDRFASEAEVHKAAIGVFAVLRQVGIRLERKGSAIEGLDLAHPIRGWRAAMVSLLVPLTSPEREVLNAAGRFVIADRQLTNASKVREKHVASGGGQWMWHPIVSTRLWAVDKVGPIFHANRVVALAKLNEAVASLV